jgi:hypothetical protein
MSKHEDDGRELPKRPDEDEVDLNPSAADDARLVIRACRICEWQGEIVERPPSDIPGCPWCHGPTDLVRVVQGPDATPGEKNPHAAALGRLGGLKGGHARAAALSPKERRAIAVKAARARWKKPRKPKS